MAAKIRANKTDVNPLLVYMDKEGAHGGSSGDEGIDDKTYQVAFILNQIGK